MRIPKYRKHSERDIGFAQYKRKRQYFPGAYNSPESRRAYRLFIATKVAAPEEPPALDDGMFISNLVGAYLGHAQRHYGDGLRGEFANIRYALRYLLAVCGEDRVESFGPLRLKYLQSQLAQKNLGRGYVNQVIGKVKRMFKWAVSEELIPPSIYHGLEAVGGLRAGKTAAKESRQKTPVSWEHVFATLTELSSTVTAMVLLQWHTGARSDSICNTTAAQFNRSRDPWEWRPKHKSEHLEKEVVLFIGPYCQALLQPLVEKAGDGPLFTPRAQRKNQRYNKLYTSSAYYRAVTRAIERVNADRKKRDLPLIPHWSPHQIRHSKGTLVRHTYGIEAAQATLGHASMDATEIYSERRLELARRVAKETG